MPPQWSYRSQAIGGGLTESMPARVLQRHAIAVALQTSSHRWWTNREPAREGLTATCHHSGLTDLKPPVVVLLRASPRGSYSNMPPQWPYRPQATGGGLTESMPPRVLQRQPLQWSYKPQAAGGGLTENMPTRVLQHHATAVVLQTSSHRWWTN